MMKKSLSPLIATFILISLTVAVGAMIVAWGRNYVQRQMECLDVDLRILEVGYDTQNRIITTIRAFYNGRYNISRGERLIFIAESRTGQTTTSPYTLTTNIEPGATPLFTVNMSISNLINDPPIKIYFFWSKCPEAKSNEFILVNP